MNRFASRDRDGLPAPRPILPSSAMSVRYFDMGDQKAIVRGFCTCVTAHSVKPTTTGLLLREMASQIHTSRSPITARREWLRF